MTIFERNLEVLPQRYPELVNLVKESPPTTHLTIESAKSGAPRLRVRTESGTTIDLHDPEDPARVASGTIEQMAANIEGVTVSLGMELGYFARAFLSKLNTGSRLIIYEADPAIFLMALRTVDLTQVLKCRWVKIVVGPQAPLRHWATQCVSQTNGMLRVVSYDPVFQLAPDIYGERVERELDRIHGIVKATKNAVIRRGPMFLDSVLQNIPHVMMAAASTQLKDSCKGMAALLVSAGPSLEKNVHHLKAAKGRAVIIAADTALNYLLPRGIVPDIVVSVDPQKETYRKFQHLEIPGEMALVYHPSVSPHIVKYFPGPTFTMDTSIPVYQWLRGFWPDKGAMDMEAMCQAHVAFNLAVCMGCDPIVFVGQDLSYTDERMHVKHGGYLTESEQAAIVADGLLTQDIFGNPVKTNPTFVNYKALFERKIQQCSGRVFQATEGGLALEGAETCLLADVIQEYCQGTPVELYHRLTERPVQLEVKDIEAVKAEVQTRARDLFRVERTSRHVCRLLETMKSRWEPHRQADQEFTRLGRQVERLTGFIPRYQQVRELLHWMDLELEIQLNQDTQDLDVAADLEVKYEKQLERGLKYYGGLIRIAPKLKTYCDRLAYRLDQWSALQTKQQRGGRSLPWLELAEAYANLDLFRMAEACLSLHFEGKNDHSLSIQEAILSIRIPLAQHQLTQAQAHAEAARAAHPENPEIKALWSKAKMECQQWQHQIELAEAHGVPGLESHVQAGDFYHRIGNFLRAKAHYRFALEEEGRVPDEAWDFFDDFQLPQKEDEIQEERLQEK